MRIQFEIKEKLADIVKEIFTSEKWILQITGEYDGLKRMILKDPHYDSQAYIEIWNSEIHIKTAWSNYTYRIFQKEHAVICEYCGAYRGLLEQNLLPQLTPQQNILDSVVLETSISTMYNEPLRQYITENVRRGNNIQTRKTVRHHPTVIVDEFVKEGVPIPSPILTKQD
ncbi:MAG: hypothetical protein LUG98_10470 [Tannerellaceae bacterium]|nr:hypothetical protein [Tannerellaceae bacterium]